MRDGPRYLSIAVFLLPFSMFVAFIAGAVAGGPGASLAPAELGTGQVVAIGLTALPLFLLGLAIPLIGHQNRITSQGVTAVMTLAGVPVRTRQRARDDVWRLEVERKRSQNTRNQPLYALQAAVRGDDPVVLAGDLHGEQQAQALRDAVVARLGY